MRIPSLVGLCLAVACGGTASSGVGSGGSSSNADAGLDGGLAAAGGSGGVADAGVGSFVSIELSQTDVHIPAGVMTAFAVTGTSRDGSRVDVTQQAQAVSSNTSVATVAHGQGAQIQITGVAPGTATVTVSLGSLQQTCAVAVAPR